MNECHCIMYLNGYIFLIFISIMYIQLILILGYYLNKVDKHNASLISASFMTYCLFLEIMYKYYDFRLIIFTIDK